MQGTGGIILMGDWRAENRHEFVADDLVDSTTVEVDHRHQRVETLVEEHLDRLGITAVGKGREPGDVREQHGDDPTLGRRCIAPDGLATGGTEAGVVRE